jgi:hypothetical protein
VDPDAGTGRFLNLLMTLAYSNWPTAKGPLAQFAWDRAPRGGNKYPIVTYTKSFVLIARRADVIRIGVPAHYGDGSTLPMLVQSGNLSLEIWSSGACRMK